MQKILDNGYYDLIISNAVAPAYNTGDNITVMNDMFSLLHVSKDLMDACDLGLNTYHNFPELYTLESTVGLKNSGVEAIQNDTTLGLFGRGVLVGLVDTGIDYRHPAFMNNDKTTRIVSIWDQTKVGSTPPRGFTYGAEYTKELINFALLSQNPYTIVPSMDTNRHGTAMASIIAGRPKPDEDFTGVVPQAELVVVKLKEAKDNLKNLFCVPQQALCYQESDIIMGIQYLINVSKRLNRPIVILLAIGSSQGGHDGRGALSTFLNSLMQQPKIGIVTAAGNEGNRNRHYFAEVNHAPYSHSIQLNSGEIDKEYFVEIWPYIPSRLSVQIIAPTWESSEVVTPGLSGCQKLTFQSIKTNVWVNNILFEEESGNQLILLRFRDMIPGAWYVKLDGMDLEPFSFHCWLPSGNLLSNETYFIPSDPNTTITSQGDSSSLLTVTAYNQNDGTILEESSRGYTRLGQIKPDVAAPGYRLSCAIPDFQYGTVTGTGAAAAHAAGITAMLLEWACSKGNYTEITGIQISSLMMRGANRDSDSVYPNNIWGYGTISAENIFNEVLSF